MSMKLTVGICLALIVLLAPEHRPILRALLARGVRGIRAKQ
jgi:hypothetical protein